MKKALKEYFDQRELKKDLSEGVLLRIKEEKIKKLKRFSFFLFMSNLFVFLLFLSQVFSSEEYKTMSGGIEVKLERKASLGELQDFLKEKGLSISGPTPRGTFFLSGDEMELQRLPRKSHLFEVLD